jgi:hypothetical protein
MLVSYTYMLHWFVHFHDVGLFECVCHLLLWEFQKQKLAAGSQPAWYRAPWGLMTIYLFTSEIISLQVVSHHCILLLSLLISFIIQFRKTERLDSYRLMWRLGNQESNWCDFRVLLLFFVVCCLYGHVSTLDNTYNRSLDISSCNC